MKIRNLSEYIGEINPQNIHSKKDSTANINNFKSQIDNITSLNFEEALINLTNDIFKQGEIIAKRCDIKELKKYKEMVSNFFNQVLNYGFEFSKQSKFDGRGRQKIYANIRKTNDKMDNLTNELLKEQKDQILILQTVEDIRGLILDTFM